MEDLGMKEEEFLKEYEKLCRKYNLIISGCGCCDSPFITDVNDYEKSWAEEFKGDTIRDNIKHLKRDIG